MASTEERRLLHQAAVERRRAGIVRGQEPLAPPDEPIEDMPMAEPDGEDEPMAITEPPQQSSPFDVFLASLPDETRELLTIDELRVDFEAAQKEARAERRKELRKAALDQAKHHARVEAGVIPPETAEKQAWTARMAKKVRVKIQMPFVADTGGVASDGVCLDGETYHHDQTYVMPRGRAETIRDILYRLHQHELDFEGKGRLHGLRRQHASGVNMVSIQ